MSFKDEVSLSKYSGLVYIAVHSEETVKQLFMVVINRSPFVICFINQFRALLIDCRQGIYFESHNRKFCLIVVLVVLSCSARAVMQVITCRRLPADSQEHSVVSHFLPQCNAKHLHFKDLYQNRETLPSVGLFNLKT